MLAYVVDSTEGGVLRENYPKPKREPGEALIRVLRAGICNTDLEILKGYSTGFQGEHTCRNVRCNQDIYEKMMLIYYVHVL